MIEAALLCLALNVYQESRGEPQKGQFAVALVTMNRAQWNPKNVCKVVYAPNQFSWTTTERRDVKPKLSSKEWKLAMKIAQLTMNKRIKDITYGSTHFHAVYVSPQWAKQYKMVAHIGQHKFYRMES
jgi:N-acetylmuramoyl-L-alanine amidase